MRHIDHVITRKDKVILMTNESQGNKKFYTLAARDPKGANAWVYWYFKIGEVRLLPDGGIDDSCDNVSFIHSWEQG